MLQATHTMFDNIRIELGSEAVSPMQKIATWSLESKAGYLKPCVDYTPGDYEVFYNQNMNRWDSTFLNNINRAWRDESFQYDGVCVFTKDNFKVVLKGIHFHLTIKGDVTNDGRGGPSYFEVSATCTPVDSPCGCALS